MRLYVHYDNILRDTSLNVFENTFPRWIAGKAGSTDNTFAVRRGVTGASRGRLQQAVFFLVISPRLVGGIFLT